MGYLREVREMNRRWNTGWLIAWHRVRMLHRAKRARVQKRGPTPVRDERRDGP